ncbi:MAG TPA: redoxin domain-containing protein [Chloroflexota bacterium]
MRPAEAVLPVEGQLPPLTGATGWLNSTPLTTDDLRDHVVMVDFCTYSCINWIRTLPHLRAWAAKYGDDGLSVVGVHTPEFDFEHDTDNVRLAAADMHVDYPLAIDNDYSIWRAFGNMYWPALYFADARGRIRYHQFGEGDYANSETAIQQLLAETGRHGAGPGLVSADGDGVEAPADWATLQSPETYLGYERAERLAAPRDAVLDARHVYATPAQLRLNEWALSGAWTLGRQVATLDDGGGKIFYRFHARDVHLVMGARNAVRFQVLIDGHAPLKDGGLDVDDEGRGVATQQRLYQLIRQGGRVAEHLFQITFLDPGVEAYVFTFG